MTTVTTTPTQDFENVINDCIVALQTQPNAAHSGEFRHNLRVAALIYGTKDEVRNEPKNAIVIRNILAAIGYTAMDTERWFEAVEVQFGLRAGSSEPVSLTA